MANRLAQESSPYLRQHANNPVDWYPWNEEALARAKSEDKPILLSVGYSACHWCHVMEHESFENQDIARLMNENFINIKVDREERPDLDQIYQNVAQLMTRSGGWPLTVFLTPDLKPFFGGTYFPPEDRYGRPGFPRVLMALSQAYRSDRLAVVENATKLTEAIGRLEASVVQENRRPDRESLRKVADALISGIDWQNGGFGEAPKFPNTMNLSFLWRFGLAQDFGMAKDAVLTTLTKMARGGIYDHLGGGFHRYSVDERWAVPHFEKMLYDNALLIKLYSEVLVTAKPDEISTEDRALYLRTLKESVGYILREMKSPEGAFYSTQDADTEGREGKFFIWNPNTVRQVLNDEEADFFERFYGVTSEGNFVDHSHPNAAGEVGESVLYLAEMPKDQATLSKLDALKKKLFDAREKRIKPGRDEKLIASWNGLMVSALAWASRALKENNEGELGERALNDAFAAMDFLRTHMTHENNRLWSVFKDGKAKFNAYLDDYAFTAQAAVDLARVADDESEVEALLNQTKHWVDIVRTHFKDVDAGGYYFTSDDHEKLIQRPKTFYDQAIPSGNAVMIECLTALSEIFSDPNYEKEADENLYRFYPTLLQTPFGMGQLACAAFMYLAGPVTAAGKDAHVACVHPHIFQKPPATFGQREKGGSPAPQELLVCHRKTCDLPVIEPVDARKLALTKIAI